MPPGWPGTGREGYAAPCLPWWCGPGVVARWSPVGGAGFPFGWLLVGEDLASVCSGEWLVWVGAALEECACLGERHG